uniref:Uncharacterized protein n=1 Tax=Anguilla anguilla TaxID=7936 RepID=A0A0E9SUF4_ANGAN
MSRSQMMPLRSSQKKSFHRPWSVRPSQKNLLPAISFCNHSCSSVSLTMIIDDDIASQLFFASSKLRASVEKK